MNKRWTNAELYNCVNILQIFKNLNQKCDIQKTNHEKDYPNARKVSLPMIFFISIKCGRVKKKADDQIIFSLNVPKQRIA